MEIGVKETEDIKFNPPLERSPEILGAMSMAVIKINKLYHALSRQVQLKPEQVIPESVLAFAISKNGIDFQRSGISVWPTPKSPDQLAVEDPTIVKAGDLYYVFHSAVHPKTAGEGVEVAIQMVTGKSLKNLADKTTILTPEMVKDKLGKVDMVKEPEFIFLKGKWYMIFEYADGITSRVALAESLNLTGPYGNIRKLIDTRANLWDSEHVSAGPIIPTPQGDILMFYNGRGPWNQEDKTPTWAIGYLIMDSITGAISVRSESPIIRPPPELGPGNQLIAFANSYLPEKQRLYYTIADKRSAAASLSLNL